MHVSKALIHGLLLHGVTYQKSNARLCEYELSLKDGYRWKKEKKEAPMQADPIEVSDFAHCWLCDAAGWPEMPKAKKTVFPTH